MDCLAYEPSFLHGVGASSIFTADEKARVFNFFRLTKIVYGEGEYLVSGHRLPVRAGDHLLLQPGDRSIHVPARLEIYYIPFGLTKHGAIAHQIESLPPGLCFSGTDADTRAVAAAFDDLRRQMLAPNSSVRKELQVQVLLSFFCEQHEHGAGTSPIPMALRNVAEQMSLHPTARHNIKSLAELACLSESQLRRQFARHYGCSPLQYVIRTRIESACQLLAVEGLSVQETAFRLGYPDAFTFSRQFRQIRGYPPREHLRHRE